LDDVARLELQISEAISCGPAEWFRDPSGMTMVHIDVTDFWMGTPNPELDAERLHLRHVNRRVALSTTEVTVEQYQQFLDAKGRKQLPVLRRVAPQVDCPQVFVSWDHAASYCNWLSKKAGLEESEWCYEFDEVKRHHVTMPDSLKKHGYRLPTEVEWEFACRAGTRTQRYHGESAELLGEHAWFADNAESVTHPVARLMPNDLGLFDMYGNALEWCDGFPFSYSDTGSEQTGKLTNLRAQRGGHFEQKAEYVRSAVRYSDPPTNANTTYGLRIAKTLLTD
jgi:formylglycine-generating enzyme required for sulfatase activity